MMYSLLYVTNGGALPWQNYSEGEIQHIKENTTPAELCAELCARHAAGWSAALDRLYAMHASDAPDYDAIAALL